MSAEAGQSATRETLNMHTLLSGKKAPPMCVIAIYSVKCVWLIHLTMASTEDRSFDLSESKRSRKAMHRFRACRDLSSNLAALLESWKIYRQSGVKRRKKEIKDDSKKALLTLRSLGLQAENARTKNTRISAHQVPNHRAEGGTVSLGKEHFLPVALKQHRFVSWKHL